MKKNCKKLSAFLAGLAVTLFAAPTDTQAQNWSWQEDFDYPVGTKMVESRDLMGTATCVGDWKHVGKAGVSGNLEDFYTAGATMIVQEATDNYTGAYPGTVPPNVIRVAPHLDGAEGNYGSYTGGICAPFIPTQKVEKDGLVHYGITSGDVYASFLLNVKAAQENTMYNTYFWALSMKNNLGDSYEITTPLGCLFTAAEGDGYVLKANVGSAIGTAEKSQELSYNTTYLVVVKYSISEALDGKDAISVYINPASIDAEPATADITKQVASGGVTKKKLGLLTGYRGLEGVLVRPNHYSSKKGVDATIGAIHVADTWAGLFPVVDVNAPKIMVTPQTLKLGTVIAGEPVERTVNVKARNLKGDISVAVPDCVTASTMTIAKSEAESEEGATLTLSITPDATYAATVKLGSEDAENTEIGINWALLPVTELDNLSDLQKENPAGKMSIFRFKSEPVITCIGEIAVTAEDAGGASEESPSAVPHKVYYLEDETAAVALYDLYDQLETTYNVGDKISGLMASGYNKKNLIADFSGLDFVEGISLAPCNLLYFSEFGKSFGTVISSDNEVKPIRVDFEEWVANPAPYFNRYIQLTGDPIDEFTEIENAFILTAEDETFTSSSLVTLSRGTESTATLKIFRNSPYVDQEIPHTAMVSGMSVCMTSAMVRPFAEGHVYGIPVTYFPLTIGEAGYATFFYDDAATLPVGLTPYMVKADNGDKVTLAELPNNVSSIKSVPANVPVVIAGEEGKYTIVVLGDFGIGGIDQEPIEGNLLVGTLEPTVITTSDYILAAPQGAESVGFYRVTNSDDIVLGANKAYLPGASVEGSVAAYKFNFGNVTGIGTVVNAAEQNGTFYDLSGRRVQQPAKGVFINANKQKVLIK